MAPSSQNSRWKGDKSLLLMDPRHFLVVCILLTVFKEKRRKVKLYKNIQVLSSLSSLLPFLSFPSHYGWEVAVGHPGGYTHLKFWKAVRAQSTDLEGISMEVIVRAVGLVCERRSWPRAES